MEKYWDIFVQGYTGYANYLWQEITFQVRPIWHNYFWMLVLVSGFFLILEAARPWRKEQPPFRKDFWLDFFYMFFNFFLFSLIIYNASTDVIVNLLNGGIKAITGFDLKAVNPMREWPVWGILLTGFVVRDFIQWWVHRLLHRSPTLWEFHKVHHSVAEMGFAAHLRYHWMENVVYRSLEYLPLAMIGFGITDFFIVHIFTLAWGHFNHANFVLPLGPLKYIFNSPQMHIWHHAKHLPEDKQYGVNFGLTLSIWDYIFKTNYIPHNGRDIELGFPGVEEFPKTFVEQNTHGFS